MYTHRHLGVRHHSARCTAAPHFDDPRPVRRTGREAIRDGLPLDPGTLLTTILVLIGLLLRAFIAAFCCR